jgi:hypothetical protein
MVTAPSQICRRYPTPEINAATLHEGSGGCQGIPDTSSNGEPHAGEIFWVYVNDLPSGRAQLRTRAEDAFLTSFCAAYAREQLLERQSCRSLLESLQDGEVQC